MDGAYDGCAEGRGFESRCGVKIFFFRVLLVCKQKAEVSIYFFKPLSKLLLLIVVLICKTVGYCEDNLNHDV